MTSKDSVERNELPPTLVMEASAWVARLHSPLRTPAVERGFRSWLQEHQDHARAFELATDSWDEVASLKGAANFDITVPSDLRRPVTPMKQRPGFLRLAFAATVAVLLIGAMLYFRDSEVVTGVGEQRLLSLEDGSKIYLNTLTRLSVEFTKGERRIRLQSGEALFEVARQSSRPFTVDAGGKSVLALGTSFVVRRDEENVAVTLVEGKVAVQENTAASQRGPTLLAPGERMIFSHSTRLAKIDRPVLEKVTAWQRGKVPIENLSLADAVSEMNRYSKVQLSIEQPEARHLRVSGIFRIGDSLSFARSVAQAYGLEIREEDERITLAGAPR